MGTGWRGRAGRGATSLSEEGEEGQGREVQRHRIPR